MRISFSAASILLLLACLVRAQDAQPPAPPSTAPGLIDAADAAALERALNTDVMVEGVVRRAEWSRSGKVMNIEFQDADNGLLAVVFDRKRAQLDEAFGGDLGKAITGARVRLRGPLKPYGGKDESMKGRPQIIIDDGHQIIIMEPAPTTQPR